MQKHIGLIKRSATRWRLVSSTSGSTQVGHLVERKDGNFEWRASGRSGLRPTLDEALADVANLWGASSASPDGTRICPWCGGPLPEGAGPLMVGCTRSHTNAIRRAGASDGTKRMRARRASDGSVLTATGKARARARARDRRRQLEGSD